MPVCIEDRKKLSDLISKYLNDEISAFDFDGAIFAINTDDETAEWCINTLWYFYDDLKDHKVVLNKEGWDLFQRILLLLEGKGEISQTRRVVYPRENYWFLCILAGMFCVPWLSAFFETGWAGFGAWVLLSLLTVYVYEHKKRRLSNVYKMGRVAAPFGSLQEIMKARRSSRGFSKQAYQSEIGDRTIRHWILETDMKLTAYLLVVAFAPLVALKEAFPYLHYETKITLP